MGKRGLSSFANRTETHIPGLVGITYIIAAFLLAACASSDVTHRRAAPNQPEIERPDRIIVYDFAATPADIPTIIQPTFAYDMRETSQTPEQIEVGRQLGALTAQELVARINDMGMNAQQAASAAPPNIGDLVIAGELLTVAEGTRRKRVLIGFGAGSSELSFRARGYLITKSGPQWLGSRVVESSGAKTPGFIVPILASSPVGLAANSALKIKGERGSETLTASAVRSAKALADELHEVFQSRGWL
jgi:hypothetical protein